jgi:D-3-phosphoglycerate dehydrogenase
MSWKVMITDVSFPDVELEQTELSAIGASLVRLDCKTAGDVIQQCKEADALLVQYAPITAEVLKSLPRLKVISRYGIGYDMFDVPAATRNHVAACNVPGYCVEEVASHALSLILYWARRLNTYQQDVRNQRWNLVQVDGAHRVHRLRGQTLGLVGAGRIAQVLGRMANSLGLNVIYYDPYITGNPFDALRPVEWDELIRTSDIVSIHCPLTEETRGLFNETALRSMKPSAVLVNTSRGALVCNSALDKALRQGWIAGAGLDNLETEPPDWEDPLLSAPNLLVTPHVAFYSEESLKDLQRLTAQAVADIYRRQSPEGLLNPEILPQVLQRLDSDG